MKFSQTLIAIAATGLLAGAVVAAPAQSPTPPAPGVTYVEVKPTDLLERFERLGVVEPSRVAGVHGRVKGFLAERLFEEGQSVEEGQVLYRIERDTYEATVMMREADLMDAHARLDLAQRELKRMVELSGTGGVAEERLDSAEIERDRSSAAVARAEAALREARLDLSYTEVVAPVSGIAGKAVKDHGDYVESGSILVTITRLSPIYVTYGISEADYLKLQADTNLDLDDSVQYQVMLKNGKAFAETGKLNYQSSEFEASTGMLRIRVEFPNKARVLRPNQFVKIIEDHGVREDVLMVPKQSVVQSPAGSAVFIIDAQNTLQFRPVKVGEWKEDQWVISTGLKAGERVMVEGLLKSKPGSPVTPKLYTSPVAKKVGF